MFKGAHPSQAVEPGPVLGQSDNAAVVGENQDNEGLPGQARLIKNLASQQNV